MDAIRDVRVWILAGVQFCFTLGAYGIGIWLPLIMAQSALSTWEIGWLSAIRYVFASVAMLLWAAWVDRYGRQLMSLIVASVIGAAGLGAALLFNHSVFLTVTCLTVALVGVTSARAVFWSIPGSFLKGAAAAGGLAFISTLGTTGGFVGPFMMGALRDWTGSFLAGIGGMAAVMVAAIVFAASLQFVMRRD